MSILTNSHYQRYDLIISVIVIIISFIVLSMYEINNKEKNIDEILKYDSGNFKIKGYVSNINIQDKYTKFKISDNTGSINGIIFEKKYLVLGTFIEGVCKITIYNSNKECNFKTISLGKT